MKYSRLCHVRMHVFDFSRVVKMPQIEMSVEIWCPDASHVTTISETKKHEGMKLVYCASVEERTPPPHGWRMAAIE